MADDLPFGELWKATWNLFTNWQAILALCGTVVALIMALWKHRNGLDRSAFIFWCIALAGFIIQIFVRKYELKKSEILKSQLGNYKERITNLENENAAMRENSAKNTEEFNRQLISLKMQLEEIKYPPSTTPIDAFRSVLGGYIKIGEYLIESRRGNTSNNIFYPEYDIWIACLNIFWNEISTRGKPPSLGTWPRQELMVSIGKDLELLREFFLTEELGFLKSNLSGNDILRWRFPGFVEKFPDGRP